MRPSLLRSFRRRVPFATPAPAEPVCVIGDVHGCFALLEQLLAQLPADHRIILAGDYIDRGVDSAQVLRFLQAQPGLTCLMGNHEDMLLRFLQDPEREGPRWIRNGGQETLQSFGIDGVGMQMSLPELHSCRDRLQQAMGPDLIAWLMDLPVSLLTGTVLITHAGADPGRAVQDQPRAGLLWGHPRFFKQRRRDGIWVVHGHTVVASPTAERGRIAIDTGAFATGRLSAVCLAAGAPRFITTHL